MSIRPIDLNGMVQNTSELSTTKSQEDQKPLVQQDFATTEMKQEAEVSTTTIREQDNVAENDTDAEGGDGTGYEGNRNRKQTPKKKTEKMGDGSVKVKPKHPHFNMSV
ncbi:MAG: hypothetical protein K5675_02325 [Lachnospiraceae bacterium]|nr:hypothetical protein [Lachnospiraceae bacterium]